MPQGIEKVAKILRKKYGYSLNFFPFLITLVQIWIDLMNFSFKNIVFLHVFDLIMGLLIFFQNSVSFLSHQKLISEALFFLLWLFFLH